ncbi:hypothetical protein AX16_005431 [Volvariella volvacea WC 439]|nr:hypothetical protein AX16_005431 [Volvariella volvacea WC 439]
MPGGAERLVVDAAVGLVKRGHKVDIYTSHHDPSHCFDETKDGTLSVKAIHPALIPRSIAGKFHILFAHLRQLHLTFYLLFSSSSPKYDVYFVDQLSTCVPFLKIVGDTRVVFYCHFPDKLLASGEFQFTKSSEGKGKAPQNDMGLLKKMYRYPMDFLEEATTGQADLVLANSKFTKRVFREYFGGVVQLPRVVYPGINLEVYEKKVDMKSEDVVAVSSTRPTLLSLNRFEKKKNIALAVETFALAKAQLASHSEYKDLRLVLAGGYDPRLEDNMLTLYSLIDLVKSHKLTYNLITSSSSDVKLPPLNTTPTNPDVLFVLNFSTAQRTALLNSPSTKVLLYTPANEHFGIGPVEAMVCGLPVLACDSGGPLESVVDDDVEFEEGGEGEDDKEKDSSSVGASTSTSTSSGGAGKRKRKPLATSSSPTSRRTGWLRPPTPEVWCTTLTTEILALPPNELKALSVRSKERARKLFGLESMTDGIEEALREASAKGRVGLRGIAWGFVAMFVGFWVAYFAGEYVLWMLEDEYVRKKAEGLAE